MSIQGVEIIELQTRVDDRGYLTEILRATDDVFTKFGQVYLVGDMKAGTIRAFHKHEVLWDWFFISHGAAKFVLQDSRTDSATYGEIQTIVASDRCPKMIAIPPGVYHGWMSLDDDTQMISVASEVYNRDNPDEERIDPFTFGDVWTIKGK